LVTVEQAESKFKYSVNKIIRLYINLLYYNRGVTLPKKEKMTLFSSKLISFAQTHKRKKPKFLLAAETKRSFSLAGNIITKIRNRAEPLKSLIDEL